MTLQRIPEPQTLSPFQEAEEYHSMNHDAANASFVDDLIAGGSVGPRVIDLGCGPADIPIALCNRLDTLEVLATDSEVEMLEIAKREIDMEGKLEQIMLQHADVCDMDDFEDGMANTVISNSMLHHLDDPSVGLATAQRLVAANGRLFVRDLYRPSSEAEVESLISLYAGGESEVAQQLFRQSLIAALTLSEIQELAGGLGISAQHVQMTSDRHWTLDWCRND
ncbi:MAG: class I SAM-dependent methyltransferase [Rubripirellula sp.]